MSLMALDFVWPLIPIVNGPLMKRKAEFLLNNCRTNYWQNILFVSNWDPPTAVSGISLLTGFPIDVRRHNQLLEF